MGMSSGEEKLHAAAAQVKQGISSRLRGVWWSFLVRGVLALALAVCALVWPQRTVGVLVKLLGIYLIIDGVAGAIGSWRSGDKGTHLMQAVVSLVAGIVLVFWTGVSAKLFLVLVGVWALLQGVGIFMSSRELDKEDDARGLMAMVGVVVAIIGLVFILWPQTGIVAISWLIAIGAFIVGALLIFLATRLRRVTRRIDKTGTGDN